MSEFEIDFYQYIGVRARMQRIDDAKCFNVWVTAVDDILAVVEADSVAEFAVGQRFRLQVSGPDSAITFTAELKRLVGAKLRLTVLSPVEVGPPYEAARFRQGLDGVLQIDGKDLAVFVEDVSEGGLGLLAEVGAPMWKRVLVTAQTRRGPVTIEGQIRYCREIEHKRWSYRIGVFAPEIESFLPFFGIELHRAA